MSNRTATDLPGDQPLDQPVDRSIDRRPSRVWALSCLCVLALVGCNQGGTVESPASPVVDSSVAAPVERIAVTLEVVHRGRISGRTGALRVSALDVERGTTTDLQLVERGTPVDASYEIELAHGEYRFTAYYDRGGDGTFNDCPFPPSPDDTAHADRYDNIQGTAEGLVHEATTIHLQLERRICGPGDAATGVTGAVRAPAGLGFEEQPVHLLLAPVAPAAGAADAGLAQHSNALLVPLFPHGFGEVGHFEIGEIVPGDYRLTFFTDDDRDGRPTPCTGGIGGGDRHLVTLDEVITVVSGERFALAANPVLQASPGCPELLTGLRLPITLDPDTPIDGALYLALVSPNDGEIGALTQLAPKWTGDSAYTVTGLPVGHWRVEVWLDSDGDGAFVPCGGLPAGLDRVYGTIDEVRIRAEEVTPVGAALRLAAADCDDIEMTQLMGRVWMPDEMGPAGSGRRVRLDLFPVDEAGERRSVLLFDNHRAVAEAPAPFARGLVAPAGRYYARMYLDSNGDGEFTSCLDDPYGDRAATPEFFLEVGEQETADLDELSLPNLGCEVPPASIRPQLRFAAAIAVYLSDLIPLRLQIVEAGGWASDQLIDRPDDILGEGFDGPTLRLAPGQFTLTLYLDTTPDGVLGACGTPEADAAVGRVEVALTSESPSRTPSLVIEQSCGP